VLIKNERGINMEITADMKLRPLGSRVIVRPEVVEEKSKGGVYIPDTVTKERPQIGIVVAVGDGKNDKGEKIPMEVKVDNKIIFSKYAGTEIKVGDQDQLILAENDILAIVE
jgi:chaperonin GroES